MKLSSTGVILLNMGGPDTLDDVRPFLYNLFSDRDIIKLGPSFLQKPIAWMISRKRAPHSREIYAKIGNGSPLRAITNNQANALEQLLQDNEKIMVRVAMRYWHPRADEAIQEFVNAGVKRIIALPLYPHYTKATSGSSLTDLRTSISSLAPGTELVEIPSWPTATGYIQALADKIQSAGKLFNNEHFQLVYSAHSLPVSFIQDGDPYVDELQKTIDTLEKTTGIQGKLCYQSRSGPVEWLSPSTDETLTALANKGCKNILMVPISFVSDHVETLYEINMLFRDKAQELGMRLESTESLNTDPTFISALRDLVVEHL